MQLVYGKAQLARALIGADNGVLFGYTVDLFARCSPGLPTEIYPADHQDKHKEEGEHNNFIT
jgi:hypothetical protein